MRIEQHPILEFDRGEKVVFFFNGQPVDGYTSETIAAALHAAGTARAACSAPLATVPPAS